MADLLLELFSEEIPARLQKKASDDLARLVSDALADAGLTGGKAEAFATPRRLTLTIADLPTETPDVSEERRGPRADAPDKAIEGFLRGVGLTRDQLEVRETPKGEFLFAVIEKKGVKTAEVLATALPEIIRTFPWPKAQRWGAGDLRWIRPLQSILCLLGGAVVDFTVGGIAAGDSTEGHRFMAPGRFAVTDFTDYRRKLLDAKVILDPARRMTLIADSCQTLASAAGLDWVRDEGLLAEVAGLCEWPVPMLGGFAPAFLAVPEEVLILKMKHDQKYFVLRDKATGKLAPKFIFTANIEPRDGGTLVTSGNERVLAARLADAQFFYETDKKTKLADLLPKLDDIVFHAKLGTVGDRARRMEALARHLADFIPGCDAEDAATAARLAKADLVTGMVGEIAEVQGLMGADYARHEGYSDAVADAIADQYSPKGPSDRCPTTPVSIAVALAEKLDTLVGFFAIGEKPTGSGDPYALRRAALGVIRLVLENGLRINLEKDVPDWPADLSGFFIDRLKVQQRDKGIRHDLIDAVVAKGSDDLVWITALTSALSDFVATDDGANLLAGYKRASNILAIEEKKDGCRYSDPVNTDLLAEESEKALAEALAVARTAAAEALETEDFAAAMTALAALRAPIDAFFDGVKVNADDANVRANRLALLGEIRHTMNHVADFSVIEG